MSLIIPVGIPGCGKSTLIAKLFEDVAHVSSDAIRDELIPNGATDYDPSLNGRVFDLFHDRIDGWLNEQTYVVAADATNLDPGARTTLRMIARERHTPTHVLFFTNVEQAIERNIKRDRVVPPEAMERMIIKYEQALRDVPTEGYDSITYIAGVH